jgi:hypothetical protein
LHLAAKVPVFPKHSGQPAHLGADRAAGSDVQVRRRLPLGLPAEAHQHPRRNGPQRAVPTTRPDRLDLYTQRL